MSKIILVSIKPEFVDKIFNHTKKIELRKVSPNANPGDLMIIYSTYPEMAIVGICRIERVIRDTPVEIWKKHSDYLGIDKARFFDYYSNSTYAVGIVIDNARRLRSKIPLQSIKNRFPSFSPPQTFKYFSRKVVLDTMAYS